MCYHPDIISVVFIFLHLFESTRNLQWRDLSVSRCLFLSIKQLFSLYLILAFNHLIFYHCRPLIISGFVRPSDSCLKIFNLICHRNPWVFRSWGTLESDDLPKYLFKYLATLNQNLSYWYCLELQQNFCSNQEYYRCGISS